MTQTGRTPWYEGGYFSMGRGDCPDLLWVAAFATCIKLLLVPSYRSTDFEVHRHWLAITHSLPLQQWYSDNTSEWTLDYPPFFAWFEKFMSMFAQLVDPRMVDLTEGLNYASNATVLFQRLSVMVADGVLYVGIWKCARCLSDRQRLVLYLAVVLSPGLLIVDHIHFQYNGFLLGILLISIGLLSEGNDVAGAVSFAVLVCFKHLFAVAGPVYFVYLLRHYCRGPNKYVKFLSLGAAVMAVVGAAFGPFVYYGQIGQVLERLFPFGRGLCHAYWAPNFWALYNFTDKVLALGLRKLGFRFHTMRAGLTGGLVGDFSPYAVLPQITPAMTMALVLVAMLPCLIQVWRNPVQTEVARWISYAYSCGFMFGWHVHEKASLHMVIPFSLMAVSSPKYAGSFLFLSTVSYYALFPLLFDAKEYPIKVLLLVAHSVTMYLSFADFFPAIDANDSQELANKQPDNNEASRNVMLLGKSTKVFLLGLVAVECYCQLVHRLLFNDKLPFVPLMLVSVYCSVGLLWHWAEQCYYIVNSRGKNPEKVG